MGFNPTMMKRVGSLLLLLWLLLLAMGLMKALEVLSSIFSSWRTFTSRRLAANPQRIADNREPIPCSPDEAPQVQAGLKL